MKEIDIVVEPIVIPCLPGLEPWLAAWIVFWNEMAFRHGISLTPPEYVYIAPPYTIMDPRA